MVTKEASFMDALSSLAAGKGLTIVSRQIIISRKPQRFILFITFIIVRERCAKSV